MPNPLESTQEYWYGVVTSIAFMLVRYFRSWYPRLADFARNNLTSTPTIDLIRRNILASGYVGNPKARYPHYYVRDWGSSKNNKRGGGEEGQSEKTPTYHLFVSKSKGESKSKGDGVELQEFMGFMIPSLDFGHGREGETKGRNHELNSVWADYLRDLGERARESNQKKFLPAIESEDEKQKAAREFKARRVIFFDRTLLHMFIFETDEVFRGCKSVMEGGVSLVDQAAYDVVQYAFDIARIHQSIGPYLEQVKAIDCCYVVKSSVSSRVYTDFGLYRFDGISVLYHPIYQKDKNKSIVEERVYLGDTARQRRGIKQFREDFEAIWSEAEKLKSGQDYDINHRSLEYYRKINSDYFARLESLSFRCFAKGYYELIRERFREDRFKDLGFDL